jgi:hypothetical protein
VLRKFLFSTIILVAYFTLVIVESKNSLFLVNDDVILDQIMSGRYTGSPNSGTSFISNIFGILISNLYLILGSKYSIFGIFLIISNLVIVFSIILLAHIHKSNFAYGIFLFVLLMIIPVLVLSPTFTISSILLCGTGFIGLFSLIRNIRFNKSIFMFFVSIIILGALLRIEAFIGVSIFTLPTLLTMLLMHLRKNYFKFYLKSLGTLLLIIVGVLTFQKLVFNHVAFTNPRYFEYIQFQEVLNTYTPGSLKLHQAIISGDILRNIWSNIDFILLRNWAYADFSVFGFQNMNIGSNFVSEYSGLRGFFNSNFFETLNVMGYYLESMILVIFLIISLSVISLWLVGFKYRTLLIHCVLFLSYFTGFYYLAAVLRIPTRTSFPLLITAILLVATITLIRFNCVKSPNIYIQSFGLIFISFFLLIFHTRNEFGYSKLKDENNSKVLFSSQRNLELENFSKQATYIGPINFFPISNQGIYSKNVFWSSGTRTLPLSWATYSPYWYSFVKILELDSSNIYNSLARKQGVYWVSNPYLAEILNYYMNDRNIYRGKLCSVMKLSGKDNAEIFTFQAKETDC